MINNIEPTPSKENDENAPPSPPQRSRAMRGINVLGSSRRYPHANSPVRKSLRKNAGSNDKTRDEQKQKQKNWHIHWQDEIDAARDAAFDTISPTSLARDLDETLAEQGWSSNGNGVYSHEEPGSGQGNQMYVPDGSAPSPNIHHPSFNNSKQHRTGLSRRFTSESSKDSSNSYHDDFAQLSPDHKSTACRRIMRSTTGIIHPKYSPTAKRRMIVMSMALGLALVGYFVEVHQIMNSAASRNSSSSDSSSSSKGGSSKDWLMSLPLSFSASILGGESAGGMVGPMKPHRMIVSIEEERKRVQSLYKSRAERRRARTMPPSTFPTIPAEEAAAEVDSVSATVSGNVLDLPRLTLDLPAHRELENNGLVKRRVLHDVDKNVIDDVEHSSVPDDSEASNNDGRNNNIRHRRLGGNQPSSSPICGAEAQEASQLNPQHYPPAAHVGPKSRIVVTGALSQIGMELILQLYEQCRVNFIVGIDASCPNTRHERLDLIESRYKYIERRVPGFQRLLVPVFGIHPHPKMGEEVRFEAMGQGFDLVSRLKPTHIVHLAGLEEGRGEYTDYGDTIDASPFDVGGKRSMMRRFDSLLSMDQVFSSVAKGTESQPQVVYISSNEAADQSGVSLNNEASESPVPASVYGTSSLLKEVLASYYHRHHGVDSVGLRVPTIFGPFGRPGSLMHDLAERTVRNAAGHDVDGVPKYHRDRDRFLSSSITSRREGANAGSQEQMAYVYDVASAVVAAMQFKKDYQNEFMDPNGPTLLNIGSKLTTSMHELKDRMEGYLPPHDQWEVASAEAASSSLGAGETQESSSSAAVIDSHGLSIFDTERNRDLLGWSHKTMLHEGTKTMLAWQILKAYPFGLPESVPAHSSFQGVLDDSIAALSYHSLPCASGCRWRGKLCTPSPWDNIIETTQKLTASCPYVLYTVDLRPEITVLEKQSSPSQRKGWENWFCKIAFVSSSSKLAEAVYGKEIQAKTPMNEWNGMGKSGYWTIVAVEGTQYSMPEFERSLAKLSPTKFFSDRVEKAMYVNHRRVILTTDQAVGVMQHLEMNARTTPEKKTIQDEKTKEDVDIWLPPQPKRHSVFFTNKYSFEEGFDTSSAKNLAKFVMTNAGIAETKDIRAQIAFYEQTGHLTRTNMQRSPNYQEFFQDNFFPYDFLRSSWVVHDLKTEEGRNLRCEIYEEHALWGNSEMEDLSMGFVLAKRKVQMQLGEMRDHQYTGPEEWYPLLVPREADDDDAITEGPVYLDYLEAAHKIVTDSKGHEFYVTFLPQKRKD